MKLQTRARMGVVIVFAGLIVLIAGLTGRAFTHGLAVIELREAHDGATRLRRIVDAEIEMVQRTARDYAEWDDTLAYVSAPNSAYEAANWTADSLGNVQVDTMLLYDASGTYVGGTTLAPGGGNLVPPNADQRAGLAGEAHRVATAVGEPVRLAGLCRFDGGPALFACTPVLPTGATGRARGSLLAVRRIDERMYERMERILGVRTEVLAASAWPDAEATPGESDVRIDRPSEARMSVALLLRDTAGLPLLGLRTELERTAYQEGVRARWLMLWQLVGAAVLVAGVTHWLLRRLVIGRLEALSSDLGKIGDAPGRRGRVRETGTDEIATVARRVNEMIDGLERGDREREQTRREREMLQEQLLHSQKMEAVGEFAGGVAHDFNNCLTSIAGWLQLTKEELPADHGAQENLVLALNSVAHASSVVHQLLTYSRHGSAPLAELCLGDLLSESLVLLRSGLPRTIELRLHADGVDDHVVADRTQLLQVLMNLLNNARDAMGTKGVLTISLGAVRLPAPTAAPASHLPPGDYVRLTVQDTGPGIPPELCERIFKPFFTTKPAGKGTGLGLAVVQSVVSRHEGTVWVESEPGRGATFHVLLPHRPPAASGGGAHSAGGIGVRGMRVLMAEDEPSVARVLTTVLRRRGCEVEVAEDGAAAWEILVRGERTFDVVLTDLTMPRLSGMQLVERILDSGRNLPVVLMTAYGSTLDAEHVRQAGFAAVLSKPLMHDDVLRVLAQVTGRLAPAKQ